MKLVSKMVAAAVSAAAIMTLTACGGSSGSGSETLPTGAFLKEVAPTASTQISAPFYTGSQYSQFLVLSDEINGSGEITSISFRSPSSGAQTTCSGMTIKMGPTSLSELTSTYADNVQEGQGSLQTVVAEGNLTLTAVDAGGLFTINLDNPFYYNGADNLVLQFEMTGSCGDTRYINSSTSLPNTLLHSGTPGDTTGILYDYTPDVVVNFAGGVNTQVYGGTGGNYWPFSAELPHTQNLYMAADINGSGPITGLGFQVNQTTPGASYVATIKMGHSTLSDLQTTFADNSNDLKVVAQDINFTIPANLQSGEWFWVPLNGSFKYNGTDNLIVDVEVTAGTENTTLMVTYMAHNVRAWGYAGSATASGVGSTEYHAKFRFNGTTEEVITSGNVSWDVPFYSGGDYRTQILYDAYQLGTGGTVKAVSFRLDADSAAADYTDATIVLAQTTNTTLSSTFDDNVAGGSTVYTGTITIPAGLKAGDWVTLPISNFTYDPTKNLVIDISQNAGSAINAIRTTNSDVPGASGVVTGPRTSATATESSTGQADLRLTIIK